jgi:hypothetical protein
MAEGHGMSIAEAAVVAVPAVLPSSPVSDEPDVERPVRFRNVYHVFSGDNSVKYMQTGDDLTIAVEYEAFFATEDVVFSLEIRDDEGDALMRTDTSIIGTKFDVPRGVGVMHFGIENMPLLDGAFSYAIGIQSRGGMLYDWKELAGEFEVMNPGKTTGTLRMSVHAAPISTQPVADDASAALAQPF